LARGWRGVLSFFVVPEYSNGFYIIMMLILGTTGDAREIVFFSFFQSLDLNLSNIIIVSG
jgi:hypothetical protein